MPFDVKGDARSAKLTPGDRVRFRLAIKGGHSWVDRLEVHFRRAGRCRPAGDRRPRRSSCRSARRCRTSMLTDQDGAPVALSALKGKVVAVTFIYSRCPLPDYCPRMVENFRAVRQRFADRMDRDLVFLTISFDPQVRHAGGAREVRRVTARRRAGLALPHRRSRQGRARLQRVRDSVLGRGRADHALAADRGHRSRRPPGGDGRRQGLHAAAARRPRRRGVDPVSRSSHAAIPTTSKVAGRLCAGRGPVRSSAPVRRVAKRTLRRSPTAWRRLGLAVSGEPTVDQSGLPSTGRVLVADAIHSACGCVLVRSSHAATGRRPSGLALCHARSMFLGHLAAEHGRLA